MSELERARAFFMAGNESYNAKAYAAAESAFRSALLIAPGRVSVLNNLAVVLLKQEKFGEAGEFARQVLEQDATSVEAWLSRGLAFKGEEKSAAAVSCFKEAIRLDPACASAWLGLGELMGKLERYAEGVDAYQHYLAMHPEDPEAWLARGELLHAAGHYAEARADIDRALVVQPDFEDALISAAAMCGEQGAFDEVLAICRRALDVSPDCVEAYMNQGAAFERLGRNDEALIAYKNALRIKPDHAEAHFGEALIYLLKGEFKTGWEKYEYRWLAGVSPVVPRHREPRLPDLSVVPGKKLLIWCEQGFGDSLQFARYLPLLVARGAEVVVEAPIALQSLIGRMPGVAIFGTAEGGSAFDYQCPLVSLPRLFGTEMNSIPACTPYLFADPAKVMQWGKDILISNGKLNVGIACSGNPGNLNNAIRSMRLELFSPLLAFANLYWIQKDISSEDEMFCHKSDGISYVGSKLNDFDDTAAILANMDAVVCVETSLAHLAGAMGVQVHILLAWAADWRWLLDRPDSPWYPTARLHRQSVAGDWEGAMQSVVQALQEESETCS